MGLAEPGVRPNLDRYLSRCILAGRLVWSSRRRLMVFPYKEMAGTDLSSYKKGPPTTLTTHTTWRPLSHSHLWLVLLRVVELGYYFISLANPVILGVGEQSSASGMALYSDFCYAIYIEFVLGYLAIFVACLALIYTLSSYSNCFLRPNDLGKDTSSLCFRACFSILPVHPKGGRPGGC